MRLIPPLKIIMKNYETIFHKKRIEIENISLLNQFHKGIKGHMSIPVKFLDYKNPKYPGYIQKRYMLYNEKCEQCIESLDFISGDEVVVLEPFKETKEREIIYKADYFEEICRGKSINCWKSARQMKIADSRFRLYIEDIALKKVEEIIDNTWIWDISFYVLEE